MRRHAPLLWASLMLVVLSIDTGGNHALCLTSRDVPSADLPAGTPTSALVSTPASGTSPSAVEDDQGPDQTPLTQAPSSEESPPETTIEKPDNENSWPAKLEGNGGTQATMPQAAGEPGTPPPALDAGALMVGPELGDQPLNAEVNKAISPTLAASLRLTESARKRLGNGQTDAAVRELGRAVSLDPSDAFAYYYLGRAYLARKNYTQALTFFRRAVIGFNGRADWSAEALSYEGLCDEELGKPLDAAEAYKRALSSSPNNFRARVGYGRLASIAGPLQNPDGPAPNQDLAIPPPGTQDEPAPPELPPAPPPE